MFSCRMSLRIRSVKVSWLLNPSQLDLVNLKTACSSKQCFFVALLIPYAGICVISLQLFHAGSHLFEFC
jgi:hypothetical protein